MQKISENETPHEHLQRLYRKEFSVKTLQSLVKFLLTGASFDCSVSGKQKKNVTIAAKVSAEMKKQLYALYLKRHDRINNWDLVNRSAPYVVGGYLFNKSWAPLYKLAKSKNIWERRTAIVATYFFIRQNEIEDAFKIAELLVHDKEDLINKAVGSWIREAGKRDEKRLMQFLDKFGATMPRVTLRYATEKLDKKDKKVKELYMNKSK